MKARILGVYRHPKGQPPVEAIAATVKQGAGTRAAQAIEHYITGPLARSGRAGAALAHHISNCTGCQTDTARLDGDGTRGSSI